MKINNLTYSYDGKVNVLKDISIAIPEGEITAIVGGTGSGKTTLMNILNLLKKVKDIDYILKEKTISELKKKDLRKLREDIGVTFQLPEHQIFGQTVEEDIKYSSVFNKEENIDDNFRKVINLLNIKEDILEISPFSTSEGEKRKITLAGVLMKEPEYIFLDEPTSNIDDYSTTELINSLKELKNKGKTIVFISHDLEVVERLSDNIVILEDGQVKASGMTKEYIYNVEKYSSKLISPLKGGKHG